MILTFEHACLPQADGQRGCPIAGREIQLADGEVRLNEFVVPDVRCNHTYGPLKLVAIDGDRNI